MLDEETLRNLQKSPVDGFGITHHNILCNEEADKLFCLLETPSKEAVEKYQCNDDVKCEWLLESKITP